MDLRKAVLLLAIVVPVACSTSRGSLFEAVVEGDRPKEESAGGQLPEDDELVLKTRPRGAEIYLNNRYQGTSPVTLNDLEPGRYRVAARLAGHRPESSWIDYRGGEQTIWLDLEPITGLLTVIADPDDARVLVGSGDLPAGTSEVPIGTYTVVVRKFGYRDHVATVSVAEGQETRLTVGLEIAAFEITEWRVARGVFNPGNPGLTGRARIEFDVTTRGSGSVVITDTEGRVVHRAALPRFEQSRQTFTWDGRGPDGRAPDGRYALALQAEGEGGGAAFEAVLRIDSGIRISYRSLWSGASGLLYAAGPDILPEGSVQLSTLLLAHAEDIEGESIFRAPVAVGARVGLFEGTELDITAALILENVDTLPYVLSAAMKRELWSSASARLAATGRLTWHAGTGSDTFTNFAGLAAGLPASIQWGRLSVFVTPEAQLSPWRVTYDRSYDDSLSPGLWLYGRTGALLDFGDLMAGVSAAFRSQPAGSGFGLDRPFQTGAELHVLIPRTQLFVTAALAAEIEASDAWYLMGGVGLGLLE